MTVEPDDSHEARHELYEIMEASGDFEDKARQALELAEEYLGVDNGHMTVIDPETDYWEAIASSDGSEGEYGVGTVLDLQRTFCRETTERDDSLVLHDVPNQGWSEDPAFEATDLHTYHGTTIELQDDLYGTVCFVADCPRGDPFAEQETLFAELVARRLEYELSCEYYESELDRRADLLDVVNRVLRHNLRNDLNLVRGKVRMLSETEAPPFDTEPVIETVEELLELSETARQLDSIVRRETAFTKTNVASLVDATVTRVADEYPDASITVDGPTEAAVLAKPTLETAFRELVENAAKHSGERPEVAVFFEETEGGATIQVSDEGDGLPMQERSVLTTGAETPLVHGNGLGLWMVYWIVSDHGGSIDATVTDAGTTITVSLPQNPLTYA